MLALLFAAALVGETLTGPVVALDGNTLLMDGTRVRLYGVAAPEMRSPFGPRARAALDDLIDGREVDCLVLDVDSRGRAVAACETSDGDLSEAVLRAGLGTAYRIFTYAAGADVELAARLDAAEAAAGAEGLGLWAAAAAADRSLWQAIIDDPRSVVTLLGSLATLIAAFAGFFFGALWSHVLTTKRDEARRTFEAQQAAAKRDEAQRTLAAELHAELRWVMSITGEIIDRIGAKCPADLDDDVKVDIAKVEWRNWSPPPMPIFEAHIGKLGLLPQEIAKDLIDLGGRAKSLTDYTAGMRVEFEGASVKTRVITLRALSETHNMQARILVALNVPLAELAGVAPYDWRNIEASLGPEPAEAAEPGNATGEPEGSDPPAT